MVYSSGYVSKVKLRGKNGFVKRSKILAGYKS